MAGRDFDTVVLLSQQVPVPTIHEFMTALDGAPDAIFQEAAFACPGLFDALGTINYLSNLPVACAV